MLTVRTRKADVVRGFLLGGSAVVALCSAAGAAAQDESAAAAGASSAPDDSYSAEEDASRTWIVMRGPLPCEVRQKERFRW